MIIPLLSVEPAPRLNQSLTRIIPNLEVPVSLMKGLRS